jgi:uncharacterized protein YuzE
MQITVDERAGATYVAVSDAEVVRTVEVSDLVMVDVDSVGEPVGVDFAMPPAAITDLVVERVLLRFPDLKQTFVDLDRWLGSATAR